MPGDPAPREKSRTSLPPRSIDRRLRRFDAAFELEELLDHSHKA
jgi:hypothetical protein